MHQEGEKMKKLRMLSGIVVAGLLLSACSSGNESNEPKNT